MKLQVVHVGKGQCRKGNINDEPIQHRGRVVWQPPRTAQENAKKEAGNEKKVVVQPNPLAPGTRNVSYDVRRLAVR